jgi:two-component system chemotaxis response regulator CheB
VVLTGELDDGTAGLAAIKDCGGTALVQDPATALAPGMPASALANVAVDACLPLPDIASALADLAGRTQSMPPVPAPARLQREHAVFEGSGLWEIDDAPPLRYRCHTGHAFTSRSLESAQVEQAEHSLWSSARSLQEREMLLRRLAVVAELTGDPAQAEAGRRQADKVKAQAQRLAELVEKS